MISCKRTRVVFVLAATIVALLLIPSGSAAARPNPAVSPRAPSYVMAPASCSSLGPALADLVDLTAQALISATTAAFAADSLRSGRDYKTVEDSASAVHQDVLKAYLALGPVMTANNPNRNITAATAAVRNEAQGELQVAQQLAFLALNYERTANSARARRRMLLEAAPFLLVAPVAAGAYMAGAAGAHTTTSHISGTVNGQPYAATTTTQDYAEANAISAATAATQTARKEALEMYGPQVGTLVYVIYPLENKWITACRAAHQLR